MLAHTDLEEMCQQAETQGEQIYRRSKFSEEHHLPRQLGQVCDRRFQLRQGLMMGIRSGALRQTIRFENPHGQSMPLVAKFHLSGNSRVLTPNVSDVASDYSETAGNHYFYYLPDLVEFEEWYEQESIQVVMILLEPNFLKSFCHDEPKLPSCLQQAVSSGTSRGRFHQPVGCITPAMAQILHHILHCPYHGMLRQMYLESKALELLMLQLLHWCQGETALPKPKYLQKEDIERLHQVKDILMRHMDAPPSLLELARQVGVNDHKLKRGFRQLFGTTVFGYLHQVRLEKACQLLASSTMSVTEVAYMIGYNSVPSFSHAFRKKYGSSPLVYRSVHR
ncbi:MAG: AraC family transcriptional regulator [Cyanobacteria bacterium P01_D01_bin.115]